MKLSTKGRYAVMATADITLHSSWNKGKNTPLPLSSISLRQNISLNYLEQLFLKLRKAGVVRSIRGSSGGYVLAKSPQDIYVYDIMRAVDEGVTARKCTGDDSGCMSDNKCITHDLWCSIDNHIGDYLKSITIKDVVDGNLKKIYV
jgi:Rrf2 family iron-sulfur cluster assembly transcriptional regulator